MKLCLGPKHNRKTKGQSDNTVFKTLSAFHGKLTIPIEYVIISIGRQAIYA